MIQDIEPLHLNNEYHALSPKKGDKVFCFRGQNEIYITQEQELDFPTYEQVQQELGQDQVGYIYLFQITDDSEETRYFLMLPKTAEEVELHLLGYAYDRMFSTRSRSPKEAILAAATAYHLYVWYRDNRYCGRCGQPVEQDKKQRMLFCKTCNNMIFPKIAPAVIIGVFHQDRLLLTKYANREYTRYALVAGFTEIGETPEETVKREVMEEVGLKVKNIRYYASQPWGFDSNLLLGYFAQLDDSEDITLDTEELSTAVWMDSDQVPDVGSELSLTGDMMEFFTHQEQFQEWYGNAYMNSSIISAI